MRSHYTWASLPSCCTSRERLHQVAIGIRAREQVWRVDAIRGPFLKRAKALEPLGAQVVCYYCVLRGCGCPSVLVLAQPSLALCTTRSDSAWCWTKLPSHEPASNQDRKWWPRVHSFSFSVIFCSFACFFSQQPFIPLATCCCILILFFNAPFLHLISLYSSRTSHLHVKMHFVFLLCYIRMRFLVFLQF